MHFNPVRDAWIPCMGPCGDVRLQGLGEVFAKAEEIRDLAVQPHERIALMRLLQCITLAAGGIENAAAYLREWEGAFELYAEGAGGAFLQLPGLEGEARVELRKLAPAGTAGNTSSLFENDAARAQVSPAQAALHLLTLQNFAPCGTIGTALWAGEPTARKTPDACPAGPCAAGSALHALLLGRNLRDTLLLSLRTLRQSPLPLGRPVWEQMPQSPRDSAARLNATGTLCGRLVPLCRSVRLAGDRCILARGLDYGSEPSPEPSMPTADGRPIGTAPHLPLWRCAPTALASLSGQEIPPGTALWMGCLMTDRAKVLGTRELRLPLPAGVPPEAAAKSLRTLTTAADALEARTADAAERYAEDVCAESRRAAALRREAALRFRSEVQHALPDLLRADRGEVQDILTLCSHRALSCVCPHADPRARDAARQAARLLPEAPVSTTAPAATPPYPTDPAALVAHLLRLRRDPQQLAALRTLLDRTGRKPGLRLLHDCGAGDSAAELVAALFALHPYHTERPGYGPAATYRRLALAGRSHPAQTAARLRQLAASGPAGLAAQMPALISALRHSIIPVNYRELYIELCDASRTGKECPRVSVNIHAA
ncbi:MAG: type I-E CRISPR-associated protein Cse1/CasA [Akkermansia muciniphila]|nr:type I-E CRISPR-associated protein Cse1/CasA [Akkermansia muciniphila]